MRQVHCVRIQRQQKKIIVLKLCPCLRQTIIASKRRLLWIFGGLRLTAEKYCHQVDEMLQKFEYRRPHWSIEKEQFCLGYKILPPPLYSLDLLAIDYQFFKHLDIYFQDKWFKIQVEAFNNLTVSRTPVLCYRHK